MPRKKREQPERQPLELNELKELLSKFLERYKNIENELELLKQDQKELIEEFEDRIDSKTLKKVIRMYKLLQTVDNKDTFDLYSEVIEDIGLSEGINV